MKIACLMSPKTVFKHLKYYSIIALLLGAGLFGVYKFVNSHQTLEHQKLDSRLEQAHSDAILRAEAAIEVYATLVSSLKSYTINQETFPSELQLQKYLKDLLKEINFKDSILVNYINKDHVFEYVVTPNEIDAAALKGISVRSILSPERVEELDELMKRENIVLFSPINLREGWAGFPFNFSARNLDNEVLGYVAPVLNVKYLLDYFYNTKTDNNYVHRFIVNDSFDLTREAYYDGSEIFNNNRDSEYYKNFNVDENNFIYSNITLFGSQLKIGSAYKIEPKIGYTIAILAYVWYGLIALLTIVIFNQFIKNTVLNKRLIFANADLEANLLKIQTLIKEIHHRVKNNMHMIAGILTLQEDEEEDEKVIAALNQSRNRIQSMSLVHEKLYGSKSLNEIKIKEYILELIGFVEETVGSQEIKLKKTVSVDADYMFDGDTTSNLGLIVNELITNSFKYAFNVHDENILSIFITKDGDDTYKLVYSDSGKGLPQDFNISESTSLGMQLIQILTEQLRGTLTYNNDSLSAFTIYFKPLEKSFKDY